MDETNVVTTRYLVPTYKLEPGEVWFHFLHGNVPGHEIDFMYRPDVPQAPLTRQHFSHLARIVKYIEPRPSASYSFAITNLSRDDTQHEAGHGGVAFVFGLRIDGTTDHAGRRNPPFCHAAATIDRQLDAGTLYHVAVQIHRKLLPPEPSDVEGSGWYRCQYVPHAENPEHLGIILKSYVQDFADLYVPGPSRQTLRWSTEGSTVPRRVTVVYPDRVDFPTLAGAMARFAEVLIESDIKWTAVSNGREQDVPGGLTVRFLPRHDATEAAADEVLLYLEHVPENPADIAFLFNAREAGTLSRMSALPPAPVALRAMAESAKSNGSSGPSGAAPRDAGRRPWAEPAEAPAAEDAAVRPEGLGIVAVVEKKHEAADLQVAPTDWTAEYKKNERKQRKDTTRALVATVVFALFFGLLAVMWIASAPDKSALEPTVASVSGPAKNATASPGPTTTNTASTVPVPTASENATNAPSAAPSGPMTLPPETVKVTPTGKAKKAKKTNDLPF